MSKGKGLKEVQRVFMLQLVNLMIRGLFPKGRPSAASSAHCKPHGIPHCLICTSTKMYTKLVQWFLGYFFIQFISY